MTSIDGRDWTIELNGERVDHLFDEHGSETFDPTQAISAAIAGTVICAIIPGDKISFTLEG